MDESIQLQERIARLSEQVTAADRRALELKRERALAEAEAELDELRKRTNEPDGDRLTAEEREAVDCWRAGAATLTPTGRRILEALDRLAPPPRPSDPLQELLAEMRANEQAHPLERANLAVWADRIEAALRAKDKKGSVK